MQMHRESIVEYQGLGVGGYSLMGAVSVWGDKGF
jgi:hypothetical protein